MDMGCAPKRVLTTHPADQIADLAGNGGPTRPAMPDLPGPEKAKSLAMPGDRGRGFDDVQRRAPVAPDPREENPKQTVGGSQLRPFSGRALKDADLVPERDVLQLQRSARAEHRTQRRKDSGQQDQHRIKAIFSNRTGFPIGTGILGYVTPRHPFAAFRSRPERTQKVAHRRSPTGSSYAPRVGSVATAARIHRTAGSADGPAHRSSRAAYRAPR